MIYRISVNFETMYTKEKSSKIEYTDDRSAAIRAFSIYIENPEVVNCYVDRIPKVNYNRVGKIILAYNPR